MKTIILHDFGELRVREINQAGVSCRILRGGFQGGAQEPIPFLGELVQILFRGLRPLWEQIRNEVGIKNRFVSREWSPPKNSIYEIFDFPLLLGVRRE